MGQRKPRRSSKKQVSRQATMPANNPPASALLTNDAGKPDELPSRSTKVQKAEAPRNRTNMPTRPNPGRALKPLRLPAATLSGTLLTASKVSATRAPTENNTA